MPIIETLLHSCSTKGYTDTVPAPECVPAEQTHSVTSTPLVDIYCLNPLRKMLLERCTGSRSHLEMWGGMTFLAQDCIWRRANAWHDPPPLNDQQRGGCWSSPAVQCTTCFIHPFTDIDQTVQLYCTWKHNVRIYGQDLNNFIQASGTAVWSGINSQQCCCCSVSSPDLAHLEFAAVSLCWGSQERDGGEVEELHLASPLPCQGRQFYQAVLMGCCEASILPFLPTENLCHTLF